MLCSLPDDQALVTRDPSFDGRIFVGVGPTTIRSVARANGANQIALIVPCHRVIGANGALTGYGGGLWRKQRLIEFERAYY